MDDTSISEAMREDVNRYMQHNHDDRFAKNIHFPKQMIFFLSEVKIFSC